MIDGRTNNEFKSRVQILFMRYIRWSESGKCWMMNSRKGQVVMKGCSEKNSFNEKRNSLIKKKTLIKTGEMLRLDSLQKELVTLTTSQKNCIKLISKSEWLPASGFGGFYSESF